jgi:hypothetical protein
LRYFCNFQNSAQSKQSPIWRKFAQSGLEVVIPVDVKIWVVFRNVDDNFDHRSCGQIFHKSPPPPYKVFEKQRVTQYKVCDRNNELNWNGLGQWLVSITQSINRQGGLNKVQEKRCTAVSRFDCSYFLLMYTGRCNSVSSRRSWVHVLSGCMAFVSKSGCCRGAAVAQRKCDEKLN